MVDIRLQMLNRECGFYLIKSVQALMMILPQEQFYHSLYNRLKSLSVVSLPVKRSSIINKREKNAGERAEIEKCLEIYDKAINVLNGYSGFV
jgi:hypothetical protein